MTSLEQQGQDAPDIDQQVTSARAGEVGKKIKVSRSPILKGVR